jgi:FG-GAP repeat
MTFRRYVSGLIVLVAIAAYPDAHAAIPTIEPADGSVSASTILPDFPDKPAEADQVRWSALKAAVAATIPQAATLTASEGAGDDAFGYSVALSGTTALVGAAGKTIGSNSYQGEAYVFTFNGSTWVQQQELTASDGADHDGFGRQVALSGTTALVGAPGKAIGSNNAQGAAYVFTFNGSTWVQQQELTASDGAAGDNFGYSVALSGTTALVGAYRKTIGSNSFQGAAYVFSFNGSMWAQHQELTASDGIEFDQFGWSVALSGTTALVGAESKTIGSNSAQGAAYVFTFNGSTWAQQPELTASDGAAGDYFGYSVALSGTTALVGAYLKTIGSNGTQGAAYVFTFNGSTWVQQQELTASDGARGTNFGNQVALSGTTALVGAPGNTIGSNEAQGAAYVFTFNGSTWVQQQELTASDGAPFDYFGTSVALSGTTALVGAYAKTIGSNPGQGAVYVFYPTDTIFRDGFEGMGL